MNGKKDIDPQSELDEREDEPTLPEIEEEPDLTKTGTLAAGRSAIVRSAKHAPKGPGVYRMIDGKGDVLYVGKAKKHPQTRRRPMPARARTTRASRG